MSQKHNNKSASPPQYTGDGVAVWVNTNKNNDPYLSIRITGHNTIYAFINKPKKENSAD